MITRLLLMNLPVEDILLAEEAMDERDQRVVDLFAASDLWSVDCDCLHTTMTIDTVLDFTYICDYQGHGPNRCQGSWLPAVADQGTQP
jgi:hypothetical protein